MKKDVIVALDFPSGEEALGFLKGLGDARPFVKVGMELYYSAGPDFVRALKDRGHKIFLDLKLHDIPNTVRKSMAVLTKLGVDMTNLHAAGGREMMRAALEGLTRPDGTRPLLIAVTMLTSTDEKTMNGDLLIPGKVGDVVAKYAENAAACGLDGVVCSPLEAPTVHAALGDDFLTITPGVRLEGGDKGDQKRVATPEKARELGSDFIVVGRPITAAENPLEAYAECVRQFCKNPD